LQIQNDYPKWAENPDRKSSREVDFGAWWTLHGQENEFPRWRVSWIVNTGELYAVQHQTKRFILLGISASQKEVEAAMDGWADPESPIYHNLTALAERLGVD
jgi:hypothetical protein